MGFQTKLWGSWVVIVVIVVIVVACVAAGPDGSGGSGNDSDGETDEAVTYSNRASDDDKLTEESHRHYLAGSRGQEEGEDCGD